MPQDTPPSRSVQFLNLHYILNSQLFPKGSLRDNSPLVQLVSIKTFRELALALPEAVEAPHFDKQSFRVNNKIFATLWEKERICVLMFSPLTQSLFLKIDPTSIYPHASKWGLKGATVFELSNVKKEWLQNAMVEAYCEKATKKQAEIVRAKYR